MAATEQGTGRGQPDAPEATEVARGAQQPGAAQDRRVAAARAPVRVPGLGSDRFTAIYRIAQPPEDAAEAAEKLCVEQTVEFPADLLPPGDIPDQIVGRVESLLARNDGATEVRVSFARAIAGRGLAGLLNVVFGNISLVPGVRLERLELCDAQLQARSGPRFGTSGLRALWDAERRALVCTAVKPMGLSPAALADLAHRLALGGVDLIKDDHGLNDQPFCPFEERVTRCAEAVAEANQRTGGRTRYAANVTAPPAEVHDRARFAVQAGAGALLICPGLTGFDTMAALAADDSLGVPVLAHPALLGAYTVHSDHGLSHRFLYGELMRLAGADVSIFPNFGGRFSFSPAQCRDIMAGTTAALGPIRPILPSPAGGMRLDNVAQMRAFYGDDVMLLIGGDLHRHGDLIAACRRFCLEARRVGDADA